jgi:twitching motility protein PilT
MTSSMTPRFNESSSPVPPPPPATASVPIKATSAIEQMVRDAHARQASDIHIRVGELPRFRIQGQMVLLRDQVKVTPQLFEQYLSEVLNPHQRELFAQTKELDTAVFYPGLVRCRVNCFDSLTGGGIVLRLISLDVPSIDGLGLPDILKYLSSQSQGLILVTGPTGSGKSTTLAAMLRHMNETTSRHIVTIEDPIEYVHSSKKCLISQREVGLHTLEFQNGLRAVLREDPDVILIGEMRDRVTVDTALKAAQTGHLVLGTLHTRSAINTLNRLLNIYNPDEQTTMRIQITESLVAIIAQMLIPTTDGRRTAAHEILVNTAAMQDFLVKGNESEAFQLMETGANDGMQIMNQVLCDLVLLGKISPDEAVKASPDPGDLRRRVRNEGFDPSRSSNRDFNYAQ